MAYGLKYNVPHVAPEGCTYIYVLKCPDTDLVRYVGRANDLSKRYYGHILSTNEGNTKKTAWVKSVIKKGKKPIMEVVDTVSFADWIFYEKRYIQIFKALGARLTNSTDGGDGASVASVLKGIPRSEETKRKISEVLRSKGRKITEEQRIRFAEASRGRVFGEDTRRKISKNSQDMWDGLDESERLKRIDNLKKIIRRKPVAMYKDGVFIAEFASGRDAATSTGLCYKKISAVCLGQRNSHGGYNWQFAEKIKP